MLIQHSHSFHSPATLAPVHQHTSSTNAALSILASKLETLDESNTSQTQQQPLSPNAAASARVILSASGQQTQTLKSQLQINKNNNNHNKTYDKSLLSHSRQGSQQYPIQTSQMSQFQVAALQGKSQQNSQQLQAMSQKISQGQIFQQQQLTQKQSAKDTTAVRYPSGGGNNNPNNMHINPNMVIIDKTGQNSSSSSVKKLEKQLKFKGNSLVLEESALQSYLRQEEEDNNNYQSNTQPKGDDQSSYYPPFKPPQINSPDQKQQQQQQQIDNPQQQQQQQQQQQSPMFLLLQKQLQKQSQENISSNGYSNELIKGFTHQSKREYPQHNTKTTSNLTNMITPNRTQSFSQKQNSNPPSSFQIINNNDRGQEAPNNLINRYSDNFLKDQSQSIFQQSTSQQDPDQVQAQIPSISCSSSSKRLKHKQGQISLHPGVVAGMVGYPKGSSNSSNISNSNSHCNSAKHSNQQHQQTFSFPVTHINPLSNTTNTTPVNNTTTSTTKELLAYYYAQQQQNNLTFSNPSESQQSPSSSKLQIQQQQQQFQLFLKQQQQLKELNGQMQFQQKISGNQGILKPKESYLDTSKTGLREQQQQQKDQDNQEQEEESVIESGSKRSALGNKNNTITKLQNQGIAGQLSSIYQPGQIPQQQKDILQQQTMTSQLKNQTRRTVMSNSVTTNPISQQQQQQYTQPQQQPLGQLIQQPTQSITQSPSTNSMQISTQAPPQFDSIEPPDNVLHSSKITNIIPVNIKNINQFNNKNSPSTEQQQQQQQPIRTYLNQTNESTSTQSQQQLRTGTNTPSLIVFPQNTSNLKHQVLQSLPKDSMNNLEQLHKKIQTRSYSSMTAAVALAKTTSITSSSNLKPFIQDLKSFADFKHSLNNYLDFIANVKHPYIFKEQHQLQGQQRQMTYNNSNNNKAGSNNSSNSTSSLQDINNLISISECSSRDKFTKWKEALEIKTKQVQISQDKWK